MPPVGAVQHLPTPVGDQIPPGALAEGLSQLRDIHLPDPVPMWPPAPGWWILLGLAILACIAAAVGVRARRRSLSRAALTELEHLRASYRITDDAGALARGLCALMRRTALARFGRHRVAGLHGTDWLAFLDRAAAPAGFPIETGEAMTRAMYARPDDGPNDEQVDAWMTGVAAWIRSVS